MGGGGGRTWRLRVSFVIMTGNGRKSLLSLCRDLQNNHELSAAGAVEWEVWIGISGRQGPKWNTFDACDTFFYRPVCCSVYLLVFKTRHRLFQQRLFAYIENTISIVSATSTCLYSKYDIDCFSNVYLLVFKIRYRLFQQGLFACIQNTISIVSANIHLSTYRRTGRT
jgi:hypothetical protein